MSKKPAFTLIEVMIVVAIIGFLSLLGIMGWSKQRDRADDARIKSDLDRLKIAFEDYYNDNNCYPPETWFDGVEDCNSDHLTPYLGKIPCHPDTHLPYVLERDSETSCSWFKLFGNLADSNDPDSFSTIYNGASEPVLYNYAVASSNVRLTNPSPPPSPTPSPSSSPDNQYYYCQNITNCTSYNPALFSCSPSYTNDPNCGGANCPVAGSCSPL